MIDLKNMDNGHDLAVCIACKKFDEMHVKERQPDWLKYCMAMRAARNQSKNWVIEMFLSPKYELEENEHWYWGDSDIPSLIEVDPITEEVRYILCCGPAAEKVVFFAVEVDIANDVVNILTDIDLNKLDGTKYEMNCFHKHMDTEE